MKLNSTSYAPWAFNIGTLLLRIVSTVSMIWSHGIPKILHFGEYSHKFYTPGFITPMFALILCIFAEVVCSFLLFMGLLTRIVALILVINMFFALHCINYTHAELDFFYLSSFVFLLLCGPGDFSIDKLL
ncbi:MAG: DoxX family protein [Phycisphaerales bacterium]|nr:DoxX family protein [Phycisphaerales bacterium]